MNRLKMIKRMLCYIVIGVFGLIVVGCSKKDYGLDPDQPVAISFWHYYDGAQKQILDEKVEEFNSTVGKEKGIIVEAFNQGNVKKLTQKVMDSVNQVVGAEEVPDMLAAYPDTAYAINQLGGIADISKYMTEAEIDEYIDSYIEEGMFSKNKELKIFPIAKSTEVLMLNQTDWEVFLNATGVDEGKLSSWEGLASIAEEYYNWTDSLTEEPDDGKAFFGRDAMANYMLIGSLQLGHEIFKVENGTVTLDFDRSTMRKLWNNYYVPYVNGYFASKGLFRTDDIKTGDIIAKVGSISGTTYFPSTVVKADGTDYEIKAKAYILPNFYGTVTYAVQQGAGVVVMKSDARKEYGAVEFLKWFTEIDNNLEFSIGSGYLPVKKKANIRQEVREAIEKEEGISETLQEVLYIGIRTTREYRLYSTKAFENGNLARDILDTAMESKAKEDYSKVVELMESGMSREDAVSKFVTDENFDQWFGDTEKALMEALNL